MVSGSSSSDSSFSSATYSPAAGTAEVRFFGGGADRMVEEELEAAEALAGLAHLATRESCGGESGMIRCRKGKRVKSESTQPDLSLELADSVTKCSDLAQVSLLWFLVLGFFFFFYSSCIFKKTQRTWVL